jgi:hypothetical protein
VRLDCWPLVGSGFGYIRLEDAAVAFDGGILCYCLTVMMTYMLRDTTPKDGTDAHCVYLLTIFTLIAFVDLHCYRLAARSSTNSQNDLLNTE